MKAGLWDYIQAAFSAKPLGMFVPPNWLFLAGVGLLSLIEPACLLLGLGVELAYLYFLSSNGRFRRLVDGGQMVHARKQWQDKLQSLIGRLIPPDQQRYRQLEARCTGLLDQQTSDGGSAGIAAQGQGLGRLLWIYLRLLMMRESITCVLAESGGADRNSQSLADRIGKIKTRLDDKQLSEDLRKSLAGQLEIMEQRLASQEQARAKLAFLDSELTRIQEQVELIREQAVLTTDPQTVSQRIDQVAATLGSTTQWIRDQQQIYGQVEDLLAEPPAIVPQEASQKQQ